MHVLKTSVLVSEAQTMRLAFTCEDCLHFDDERLGDTDDRSADSDRAEVGNDPEPISATKPTGSCGIFFPTDPHRRQRYDDAALDERLYFCKMFEPL